MGHYWREQLGAPTIGCGYYIADVRHSFKYQSYNPALDAFIYTITHKADNLLITGQLYHAV